MKNVRLPERFFFTFAALCDIIKIAKFGRIF